MVLINVTNLKLVINQLLTWKFLLNQDSRDTNYRLMTDSWAFTHILLSFANVYVAVKQKEWMCISIIKAAELRFWTFSLSGVGQRCDICYIPSHRQRTKQQSRVQRCWCQFPPACKLTVTVSSHGRASRPLVPSVLTPTIGATASGLSILSAASHQCWKRQTVLMTVSESGHCPSESENTATWNLARVDFQTIWPKRF